MLPERSHVTWLAFSSANQLHVKYLHNILLFVLRWPIFWCSKQTENLHNKLPLFQIFPSLVVMGNMCWKNVEILTRLRWPDWFPLGHHTWTSGRNGYANLTSLNLRCALTVVMNIRHRIFKTMILKAARNRTSPHFTGLIRFAWTRHSSRPTSALASNMAPTGSSPLIKLCLSISLKISCHGFGY